MYVVVMATTDGECHPDASSDVDLSHGWARDGPCVMTMQVDRKVSSPHFRLLQKTSLRTDTERSNKFNQV